MRNPTNDDRVLYLTLKEEARRLAALTQAKAAAVRTAFDLWFAGSGPGPTYEEMDAWEQLQGLEAAVQSKLDSLVMDLFS